MKFILNENNKFLLEERFILTEEDSPEVKTTMKWVQLLLKNVSSTAEGYTKLQKYLEAATEHGPLAPKSVPSYNVTVNKVEKTAKDLTDTLQLFASTPTDQKKELVSVHNAITAHIATLEETVPKVKEQYQKQLQKAIKTLEALNNQLPATDTAAGAISDKAFSRLLKQIQQLPNLLEQLATLLKTAFDTTAAQARQDMGLSTAMHFIGKATADITDGSTTDPKITGYTTKTAGDVIIDKNNSYEYVWTLEGKW